MATELVLEGRLVHTRNRRRKREIYSPLQDPNSTAHPRKTLDRRLRRLSHHFWLTSRSLISSAHPEVLGCVPLARLHRSLSANLYRPQTLLSPTKLRWYTLSHPCRALCSPRAPTSLSTRASSARLHPSHPTSLSAQKCKPKTA